MLKILCAGCLGLFLAISEQFTLKMCVQAEIAKNSPKPLFLGLKVMQGDWRW